MRVTLRTLAAVVAGLLVCFVLIVAVEGFSAIVHPFPAGFEGTEKEICAHVERYPDWVLAVVVPMWGATAFVGTWVAQRIGNAVSTVVVGLLLMVALVLNLWMLPYPIWFKAAMLLALPVGILTGAWSGRRTESNTPNAGLVVDGGESGT